MFDLTGTKPLGSKILRMHGKYDNELIDWISRSIKRGKFTSINKSKKIDKSVNEI